MNLSSEAESDEFSFREPSYLDDIDDIEDVDWEDASVGPDESEDLCSGDDALELTFHSTIDSYSSEKRSHIEKSSNQKQDNQSYFNRKNNSNDFQIIPTKKKRRLRKLSQIPAETQILLSTLRKSHLLIRTCHNIIRSNLCSSDEMLLNLSLSLLPAFAIDYSAKNRFPSLTFLEKFVNWFNHSTDTKLVRERRLDIQRANEARGAPNYRRMNKRTRRGNMSSTVSDPTNNRMTADGWGEFRNKLISVLNYISPVNDQNPEYADYSIEASPYERLWIFLLMTRAMRWRVRFCSTISPISMDLTPNHPLLGLDVKDVLRRLYSSRMSFSDSVADRCPHNPNSLCHLQRNESEPKVPISSAVDGPSFTNNTQSDIAVDRVCENDKEYFWVEILCLRNEKHNSLKDHTLYRWTHVDPLEKSINEPNSLQAISNKGDKSKSAPIVYAVGVEHEISDVNEASFQPGCITDITPRYSKSWSQTLLLRGSTKKQLKAGIECENCAWWKDTLQAMNKLLRRPSRKNKDICTADDFKVATADQISKNTRRILKDESMYDHEQIEFNETISKEPIPTSKAAFKSHPIYVIPSVLNASEVLDPQAALRAVGFFKGERVFLRKDVSVAWQAKQWLYRGRKVRESELSKPVRFLKARKKPVKRVFKPLETYGAAVSDTNIHSDLMLDENNVENGQVRLYGKWQTDEWMPPTVGPDEEIPVNEHKNVELALIPRGLVHLEHRRVAFIAKKLGIPYAPCLVGFEGHGGNRTPMIRGIVVHEGNADILLEAHTEFESKEIEDELSERKSTILRRWKRLVISALTQDTLLKKYANDV